MSARRWRRWRSGGLCMGGCKRNYVLKDIHSDEDLSLYSRDPPEPARKKRKGVSVDELKNKDDDDDEEEDDDCRYRGDWWEWREFRGRRIAGETCEIPAMWKESDADCNGKIAMLDYTCPTDEENGNKVEEYCSMRRESKTSDGSRTDKDCSSRQFDEDSDDIDEDNNDDIDDDEYLMCGMSEASSTTDDESGGESLDGWKNPISIMERTRVVEPARGPLQPTWHQHAWTSLDLRKYIVRKAKEKLGPPRLSDDEEAQENLLVDRKGNVNLVSSCKSLSNVSSNFMSTSNITISTTTTTTATTTSPTASCSRMLPQTSSINNVPHPVIPGCSNMSWRGYSPRFAGPRGSMQFEHTRVRDFSPSPRHRLWSLPSIVITNSDDSQTEPPPRSPSPDESSTCSSMSYLTVPPHHSPRHRTHEASHHYNFNFNQSSDEDDEIPKPRRSKSCQDVTEHKLRRSTHQLGSMMSLWSGDWEFSEDSALPLAPGRDSPPPDSRPAVPEYLEYEESFVSYLKLSFIIYIF